MRILVCMFCLMLVSQTAFAKNGANICDNRADEIFSMVKRFEALHKKGEVNGILEMFTSPVNEKDIWDQVWMKLASFRDDKTGQRANTGITASDLRSYKILKKSLVHLSFMDSEAKCGLHVVEKRRYINYLHKGDRDWEEILYFELTFQGGKWRIEKYSSFSAIGLGKYSGWPRG